MLHRSSAGETLYRCSEVGQSLVYSMDEKVIGEAIDKAVKEAEDRGIKGKDITPFLLEKIQKITGGNSLASNIELVLNNARLASEIAVQLSKISK